MATLEATNANRIRLATLTLDAFAIASDSTGEPTASLIIDLLANLFHACECYSAGEDGVTLDLSHLFEVAQGHFTEEAGAEVADFFTARGWLMVETGGGCTAYRKNSPTHGEDGSYDLITAADDAAYPLSIWHEGVIGHYDGDDRGGITGRAPVYDLLGIDKDDYLAGVNSFGHPSRRVQ